MGFIGAYRKEGTASNGSIVVQTDYTAVPDLNNQDLILIDPMLATGTSVCDTLKMLKKRFAIRSIHLATLICSPEGIAKVESVFGEEVTIWTFQVDQGLDKNAYIVPGLGDAGDLSFGEKL